MNPYLHDVIGWGVFFAVCILLGLFGADSRPGFGEQRTAVKERWFIHSKND